MAKRFIGLKLLSVGKNALRGVSLMKECVTVGIARLLGGSGHQGREAETGIADVC